ncbi:DnaD domain protein [Solibacillus sp. R5-41]|uniref:DnaD domain protein n=1 Tax=Solibacillus sp. R5-41 TaxID=2048654 RepID=UPI0012FD8504|nr:DnaD domain protein [Solibacillus sp. R5-41]
MKLLEADYVLIVQPKLAKAVGLNEALFLQQLHYWVTKSGITLDGEKWIYNAYTSWQKQFPFWSERTIRRIVKRLDELGVLISANYNRANFDKTKWYRIHYKQLNQLLNEASFYDVSGQNDRINRPQCPVEEGPICHTPPSKMATPIQKTNTKTNDRLNNIEHVFRNFGIHLTKKHEQQLLEWQTHFSEGEIIRAVNVAVKRDILNWPYVNGILQAWQKKGGSKKRNEKIPDWFTARHDVIEEEVLDEAQVKAVREKLEMLKFASQNL